MPTDPIPKNLVAVRDLLTEVLDAANGAGGNFEYGVALFRRLGQFDSPVFGALTRGGESTALTYRMLQALGAHTVYVSGRVAASIRDGMACGARRTTPEALLDQPVLHISLTLAVGARFDQIDRTMPLESTVFAGDLTAPIVLLLERRPGGWPG